ncbi:MAG: DNA polymerase III subunit gamma/tau [Blastocatellia bacterium]
MSYQVIARKWRPQTFEEVTGQEAITRTLQNSIQMQRLHHAFIFSGPRGCGKTTTARILAKAINCFEGLTTKPCGNCFSCQEIAANNAIDVLEIDAASNTGVDNVRDVIINTVAINPARDRYKIFIIDEVHMLSISAFNALLKTLEEPPKHIVFILATTELHKLPQTILSRCQHFEFKTIAAEAIAKRLRIIADAESIAINDDALMMIAFAGQGSMRDAQSAFDQVISFAGTQITELDIRSALGIINQQVLADVTLAIANRNEEKLIRLVSDITATGYDLRQFCRDLMVHFRNLLMLKTIGYDQEILPIMKSELTSYKEQAGYFSNQDLVRFFNLLANLEQEIKTSTQPRFHLEIGLIKLAQLTKLQSLEEIIFWLKALEEKITGGQSTSQISQAFSNTNKESRPVEPITKNLNIPAISTPIAPVKPVENVTDIASKLPISRTKKTPVKDNPIQSFKNVTQVENETTKVNKTVEINETKPIEPITENITAPKVITGDPIELIKKELEERRKWMLLSALEQGLLELVGDTLKISFEQKAKVSQQMINNKENRETLLDAAKMALGRIIKVDSKIAGDSKEENLEEQKQQQLLKQTSEHPIVDAFVKTFKGELVSVEIEEKTKK